MISKELLENVLDKEIASINIEENILNYIEDKVGYFEINIYELAHKCKEWAYKQKRVNMFIIETDIENFQINVSILYGEQHPNLNMHYFNEDNCEIKSIIKACEWLLDNKED